MCDGIDVQCECIWFNSIPFNRFSNSADFIHFGRTIKYTHTHTHMWERPAADFARFGLNFSIYSRSQLFNRTQWQSGSGFCRCEHSTLKIVSRTARAHLVHLTQTAYVLHMLIAGRCNRTTCYNININMYSCEVLQHNLFPFNLHIILN